MQVETSLINIPLKLNCSSISSSTPGNNVSFPQGQFIKFQQFGKQQSSKIDRLNMGHKKRLTIQINESYDFNQQSIEHSEYTDGMESATTQKDDLNKHFFKKQEKNSQANNYCIGESQSPSFANSNSQIDLHKLISYNSFLQEKFKYLENQNSQLKKQLNQQKIQAKNLKVQVQSLKGTLKKRQETLNTEKQRNSELKEVICELEDKKAEQMFYDERLREKQVKISQLQRKLEKITTMNKAFQKQLKQSDKKICELEKDLQKTFCQNQQQAINRIKQSSIRVKQASVKSKQLISNKQNQNNNIICNNVGNNLGNTMQSRKSIDKKKCTQSQSKKKQPLTSTQLTIRAQRTSSSSNIVTKKLLNLRKQ